MKCVTLGLIALLMLCSQAVANPLACRTAEDARRFAKENGQQLVWQGIVADGSMVAEVWQSSDGIWMLSLLTPMKVSCLQMFGQGGQLVPPARKAYEQPEVQTP